MKTRVFTTLLLPLVMVAASGCKVSKQIDKWVGRHYGGTAPLKIKADDYISFQVDSSLAADDASDTRRTNNQFVPALFYYQWKFETASTLNVRLPMNTFVKGFVAAAKQRNLKEKLNGASLQIALNGNPADFKYHEDGWMVYLILGYISKNRVFVEPARSEVQITYTVRQPSGETQTGTIAISNPDQAREPRFFQTTKGAINEYLTVSDSHVAGMARELADKLIVELIAGGLAKQ